MLKMSKSCTLLIDLVDCCITQNYWDQILVYFWIQALPDYISHRWSLHETQRALIDLQNTLKISPNADRTDYYEHIIRCTLNNQWPRGLSALLSPLTCVGVETGYLTPQTHTDTETSFKRWREKGWKIILIHELSTSAQDKLLTSAQSPHLMETLSGRVSLGAPEDIDHLLLLENNGLSSTIRRIISSRHHVLKWGKRHGYQPIRLNRSYSHIDSRTNTPQIIDLNFVDLILS